MEGSSATTAVLLPIYIGGARHTLPSAASRHGHVCVSIRRRRRRRRRRWRRRRCRRRRCRRRRLLRGGVLTVVLVAGSQRRPQFIFGLQDPTNRQRELRVLQTEMRAAAKRGLVWRPANALVDLPKNNSLIVWCRGTIKIRVERSRERTDITSHLGQELRSGCDGTGDLQRRK